MLGCEKLDYFGWTSKHQSLNLEIISRMFRLKDYWMFVEYFNLSILNRNMPEFKVQILESKSSQIVPFFFVVKMSKICLVFGLVELS